MAERDSWAVMNGSSRVVDAEDARLAITALWTPGASSVRARQGLRPGAGNPGLVTASGTPDVNIHVEKFQAVITATRGLGEYIATLDADKTINVLGDNPAHGTQQRNHLIIALQTDTYYTDGSTAYEIIEVVGVAGAGDPSLAAYDDYIPLARVRVTAGASTITSSMIDDLRPAWVVALGGLIPVKDSTDRATLVPYDGMAIYRRDRDWIEVRDGSAWRVQGVAVCASTADRDSAITDPYNGQLAITTDTVTVWVRAAGAWRALSASTFVAEHKPVAAVTTGVATETVLCNVSPNLVSGRRYKASWQGDMSSSTADPGIGIALRMRVKATGVVDTTGTIFAARDVKAGSGTNIQSQMFGTFVAASSAQHVIVATALPVVGTATQAYNATDHIPHLLLEEIGV